jgi:hypothetical protein
MESEIWICPPPTPTQPRHNGVLSGLLDTENPSEIINLTVPLKKFPVEFKNRQDSSSDFRRDNTVIFIF